MMMPAAAVAMAIAIKSYFQKIADPGDIASTAGVSFTINHIAAVVIPVAFGMVWLYSPTVAFLAGAAMAAISYLLARRVPDEPGEGNEVKLLILRDGEIVELSVPVGIIPR